MFSNGADWTFQAAEPPILKLMIKAAILPFLQAFMTGNADILRLLLQHRLDEEDEEFEEDEEGNEDEENNTR